MASLRGDTPRQSRMLVAAAAYKDGLAEGEYVLDFLVRSASDPCTWLVSLELKSNDFSCDGRDWSGPDVLLHAY